MHINSDPGGRAWYPSGPKLEKEINGSKYVYVDPKSPNPRPDNFRITNVTFLNGFTIVEVTYPDATSYEGKKILVFKGDMRITLYSMKELDPHFMKDGNLVARFAPTPEGILFAWEFCENSTKPKDIHGIKT